MLCNDVISHEVEDTTRWLHGDSTSIREGMLTYSGKGISFLQVIYTVQNVPCNYASHPSWWDSLRKPPQKKWEEKPPIWSFDQLSRHSLLSGMSAVSVAAGVAISRIGLLLVIDHFPGQEYFLAWYLVIDCWTVGELIWLWSGLPSLPALLTSVFVIFPPVQPTSDLWISTQCYISARTVTQCQQVLK